MKRKKDSNSEHCPKCGEEFDPKLDRIYECPKCGIEGSSRCCNAGGNNCLCVQCEESQ